MSATIEIDLETADEINVYLADLSYDHRPQDEELRDLSEWFDTLLKKALKKEEI